MSKDPLDTLREAIQAYIRVEQDDTLILTDFAIAYAAVNLHTANDQTFIGTTASGTPHATLGLAHILTRDLSEGDDE